MAIKGNYSQSEHGNFKVIDTIGVPHPFCITAEHVGIAADRHGGILDQAALEDAERHGVRCGMRGCNLSLAEHEQALLVGCAIDLKGDDGKVCPELHAYLLSIKDETEKNGYAGFAFKRGF